MLKSEPILPIRFYDNLFDQQRFNVHTNDAMQLDLIYPTNKLPYFQFRRTSKITDPTKLFLRNVCNDYTKVIAFDVDGNPVRGSRLLYKEIPESASNLGTFASNNFYQNFPPSHGAIFDNGVDPPYGTTLEIAELTCLGLSSVKENSDYALTGSPAYFTIPLSSNTAKYNFKIVVEKLVRSIGSTFSIKVWHNGVGGQLLGTITQAGIYNYSFTSGANDITIEFFDFILTDKFNISYLQASLNTFFSTLPEDVELDENELSVLPMANGTDLITYSESNQNYNLVPGEYYYIVNDGEEVYFSEVFKLVSLKQIQSYYKLFWKNTCDINDSVVYNGNGYENVLYLEASLFKPEPETKEEGEEDGNGVMTTLFKSWKKNINFEISKCPEFLTDALSAVFLHDTILISAPLNSHQEINNTTFSVKQIIPEVSSILNDYFQKVNLKLLLNNNFTESGCCNYAEIFSCTPCKYQTADDCSTGYQFITNSPPEEGDGVKDCATGEIININPTDIICYNGKYYKLQFLSNIWQIQIEMPSVVNGTGPTSGFYEIEGYVLPNTFVGLEFKKDGGAWTNYGGYVFKPSTSYYSYFLIKLPVGLTSGATDLKVRVHSKTYNCDFGYSNEYDII